MISIERRCPTSSTRPRRHHKEVGTYAVVDDDASNAGNASDTDSASSASRPKAKALVRHFIW